MTNYSTPNKFKVYVKPGDIAVDSKWRSTSIVDGLKQMFNFVKVQDLHGFDFCLQNCNILYLKESTLLNGVDTDWLNGNVSISTTIIADRNSVTVATYSKLQEKCICNGRSLLPVGHVGEIPLLLYQLSQADTVQSPSYTFTPKPTPDIQLQILLNVPGLGKTKAQKLLDVFGTVQRTAFAAVNDLVPVVGITTASQVHKYFNDLVSS